MACLFAHQVHPAAFLTETQHGIGQFQILKVFTDQRKYFFRHFLHLPVF
jgi:hypothetical protein